MKLIINYFTVTKSFYIKKEMKVPNCGLLRQIKFLKLQCLIDYTLRVSNNFSPVTIRVPSQSFFDLLSMSGHF